MTALTLSSINSGPRSEPIRVLVYGLAGIGKTTFAAAAPNPVFILTEDGLGNLETPAFPLAKTFDDILEAVGVLYTEKHEYKTVVLDSLDWAEALIWAKVAITSKDGGVKSIENYGYGKGYTIAADRMRDIIEGLNALRDTKGMNVILTAHAKVKRFDDPTTEPYDRYTLKLHEKSAAIVSEWCDVIGFATQEMIVRKEDVGFSKSVNRALVTGGRVMMLSPHPAFDAKSRFGLPDSIQLSWHAFADAMEKKGGK